MGCGISAYRGSKKEPLSLHTGVPCRAKYPRNCAMTVVGSTKLIVK